MKKSDKETAGIASNYQGETVSDKSAFNEACREQERNMMVDVPSKTDPDRGMIRKYKGK